MTKANTFIIAEAGVNHNGCLQQAQELVEIAVAAKADAVKFQTFKADSLVTKQAQKAQYQQLTTESAESQHAMLKHLELSEAEHRSLFQFCQQQQIQFLSTPFDLASADFLLKELDLPMVKVGSGDITYGPLLIKLARSGRQIILSSGMASLGDIETALAVIGYGLRTKRGYPTEQDLCQTLAQDKTWQLLHDKVTLLHCTSAYPAPAETVNLSVMDTLRQAFNLRTGFSDHTLGIAIPIAAAARGASLIEKHFTIDKKLPGPDHKASLEPEELKHMVTAIREVNVAMGHPFKRATTAEIENKLCGRRSIIINTSIKKGETLTEQNISCMRPGHGKPAMEYWSYLGKQAQQDYEPGDML